MHMALLFPVSSAAEPDAATLKELATMLGYPLSPQNPLMSRVDALGRKHGLGELNVDAESQERASAMKVLQSVGAEQLEDHDVLTLRGMIDGSEEVHIYQDRAEWIHKHWRGPADITVNGTAWDIEVPFVNQGTTAYFKHPMDFSRTRVLMARGRDVAAMVATPDKLILYLSDSPNGAAEYEMRIAVGRKAP